eukprot:SAG22_NODE_3858_length_1495_cov_2.285817_2_plen_64_part_00
MDWLVIECLHGVEGHGRAASAGMPQSGWIQRAKDYRLVPNIVRTGKELASQIKTSSPNLSGMD